ncbi:MAG: sigma-70 RNA polymerase sigma factor region 4 domain-containing protein [Armatimonadota bacterium]
MANGAFLYTETKLPPEALEVISDVLLATAGRDEYHPAYNEAQLYRKQRKASKVEEYFAQSWMGSLPETGELAIILQNAGLSEKEKTAWKMHYDGYLNAEIARCLQVSWPTVQRLIRNASRRIQLYKSKFCGFDEVYHDEVFKRIYRKPVHCNDQPCRKLGYCRYAIHGRETGDA